MVSSTLPSPSELSARPHVFELFPTFQAHLPSRPSSLLSFSLTITPLQPARLTRIVVLLPDSVPFYIGKARDGLVNWTGMEDL